MIHRSAAGLHCSDASHHEWLLRIPIMPFLSPFFTNKALENMKVNSLTFSASYIYIYILLGEKNNVWLNYYSNTQQRIALSR